MPNQLTSSGLQTATQAELLAQYTAAFQAIYGADIVLTSDSPDGQLINQFIQSVLDLEDLLTQIYNQFDPDNAIGNVLDQRVAINGIQREGGTYTITPVTITNTLSVNLYGLDQTAQPVYTVQDNAGNQWQLVTTVLGLAPAANVLNFQAANPGALTPVPNTIAVPVTVVLGVSAINNPTPALSIGENEESDAALRVRRQQSVSLASQGYYNGLLAALENINGVTSAFIHENDSNITDGDGVPSHTIWVIVAGSGAAASIAQAIYSKRNAGCGMFGAISYNITQADGTLFPVYWSDVVSEPLFIRFTATSLNGTTPPNLAAIIAQLPTVFVPGAYQEVNINALATAVQQIDPNTLVTNAGFSTAYNGSYSNVLSPSALNYQFTLASADIIATPMQLIPLGVTTEPSTLVPTPFLGLGGYGTLTYSISINNSGGSINSSTGSYTSGSTGGVTDTLMVTDSLSNTATVTVGVL